LPELCLATVDYVAVRINQVSRGESCHLLFTLVETINYTMCVLYSRRAGEMRAYQPAPLREILRPSEMHSVIFNGFPVNDQPVAARLLDGAMQPHGLATAGAFEQRHRFGDGGLESDLFAWLHFDLCNFPVHVAISSLGKQLVQVLHSRSTIALCELARTTP
jgi:hypothetical protein